jgi:hypothetical protein
MSDKVIGGTPRSASSLCHTCRNSHHIRGVNLQEQVWCLAKSHQPRIYFPVVECSIYDDKRQPALHQMETIAWHITSRNRGPVGYSTDSKTEITVEPPNPYAVPQQAPDLRDKEKS